MIKSLPLVALSVVLGALVLGGGGAAAAPAEKETICHKDGKGRYRAITVSEKAAHKHEAKHDDVAAGSDGECNQSPVRRSTGATLAFGPNGWAGYSCNAGEVAIGGGHTLTSVTDEGVAEPGATIGGWTYPDFPHYDFPAGETGYVVQNDNDSETGREVFVLCV